MSDAQSNNVKPSLTCKQQKFVHEYIKTGHITNSAISAGYSPRTARTIGHYTLKNTQVKKAIDDIHQTEAEKVGVTLRSVLERLNYWADKKEDKLAAASLKALEMLGRHLGMFNDQLRVSIKSHEEALIELEELAQIEEPAYLELEHLENND